MRQASTHARKIALVVVARTARSAWPTCVPPRLPSPPFHTAIQPHMRTPVFNMEYTEYLLDLTLDILRPHTHTYTHTHAHIGDTRLFGHECKTFRCRCLLLRSASHLPIVVRARECSCAWRTRTKAQTHTIHISRSNAFRVSSAVRIRAVRCEPCTAAGVARRRRTHMWRSALCCDFGPLRCAALALALAHTCEEAACAVDMQFSKYPSQAKLEKPNYDIFHTSGQTRT